MNMNTTQEPGCGRNFFGPAVSLVWSVLVLGAALNGAILDAAAAVSAQVAATDRLLVPRQGHTATVLSDGRVLIVGGRNESGALASAEVFDPISRTFTSVGSMAEARFDHGAVLLGDGRVLIVGGHNGNNASASAEIYEPKQGGYFRRVVSGMGVSRYGHTVSVLGNGQVLIAGGDDLGTGELFDANLEFFAGQLVPIGTVLRGHTATLLGTDSILLTGGGKSTAEYYKVGERRFGLWPNPMTEERSGHVALVSGEGRLVLLGGDAAGSVEELSGGDGMFRLKLTLGKMISSGTKLANGRVLVVGPEVAGLYSTQDATFEELTGADLLKRWGQTATELLGDSKVLIIGGVNQKAEWVTAGAIFNPASLRTDQDEYATGALVNLHGSGYLSNEEVEIEVLRADGKSIEGRQHWLAVVDAGGGFDSSWQVCDGDCAGAEMALKAAGLTSGLKAEAAFRVALTSESGNDSTQSKTNQPVRKTVSITTATGGTNISADKALNASAPAFTTLGSIVITEAAATDFSTGNNRTIQFNAPTGWSYNAGQGSVTFTSGQDITAASIAVTAAQVAVTLNVGTSTKIDTLTISGIQVQAADGGNIAASVNITRTGGTATIAGLTTGTVVGALSQAIGAMNKLVVTLPGETFTDATTKAASGNTGTVTTQTAGTSFNIVKLTATDQFFNILTTYTGAKTISYTGPGGSPTYTTAVTFAGGQFSTLATILIKAETTTITASDGTVTGPASSSLTVNAGAVNKLQLIVPGETAAPGTATGKTGTPTAATAGTAFNVTANAVDANWNVVSSVTDTVAITSSDANAALPANAALASGTRTFSLTLKTAGAATITASDSTTPARTADTSPSITVNVGAVSKLQLLAPGETAAPGSASGKTGTPAAQTAATSFNVTVRAVDASWNLVNTVTDTVGITSSDPNAFLPANAALASGTQTFSVTLKTAGTATVTASDITTPARTANTSPSITVGAGAFTKLQLLMPGETAAPGSATGKTGTPTAQTAGTALTVTVRAVDANWNLINTVIDTVGITSSDANATLPANAALVAGTKTYSVTLKTAGAQTVTATDITNGAMTANIGASTTVNAGTVTKLQLLVPGETVAPGSATGKTGTPTAQTAGTAFNATVNAVDANWNVVSSVTDTAGITSSDANAALPANAALVAGTRTFSVTLKTGGTATLTASDITTPARTANTSPSITVNGGTFTKLQLLVPGETAAPGTATGKTGTPTARTAGTAFNVTVRAVDANWNWVSSATDTVGLTSTDTNATLPANTALAGGTQTLSFTFKTVGIWTITATDISNGAYTANTSPSITANVGAFAKLQVLMPGESAAPGTATGKTGTPTAQTAATAFTITVRAVDANWNLVNTVTDTFGITSSDANATLPANAALASGTRTRSVTFKTAGSQTVTAADISDGTKTANTGTATTVNAGAVNKMQMLVPGETAAPGSASGKTGTPTAQVAGTAFNITANAVDANWNVVSSVTDTVGITSTDPNATPPSNAALVAGTKSFSVTLKTAGTATLTASDITTPARTANTSPSITVGVGAFTMLQVLMPGETAAPGTATGKTGTPTARTAATAFNVTVRAVDANWNLVNTVTHTAGITTSDTYATLPANAALAAGTRTFSVTFKAAGTRTVTATDITDGSKTPNTGASTTVNAAAVAKLLLVVPGETVDPGSATGKTGTPLAQLAGTAFSVTVNAVDANWNLVSSVTDTVGITTTDTNATAVANAALVTGTKAFNVTFKTGGTRTITASDITTPARTASTSPSITVNPGAFAKLQLLVPGETAVPGTVPGKSGTPTTRNGGVAFSVTVNAVDANWNRVTTITDTVGLTSSDGAATLPANTPLVAGTKALSVTFNTPGTATLTATDITNGAYTANTSPSITVSMAPQINTQPSNQTVCSGSSASFSVSATGSALTYQWRKGLSNLSNGSGISGATTATLTITGVAGGNAGSYDVVVTGDTSPAATSTAATLTVTTAPSISASPTNPTVCVGSSASFSVTASGGGLTYQWRRNGSNLSDGVNISGATTATLTINSAAESDAGSYDVVVNNACASPATSTAATFTVNAPIVITANPSDRTVCAGSSASLTVATTGTVSTYQWRKGTVNLTNGGSVSGATTATLTINPSVVGDAGSDYDVVITGPCSSATSGTATLTVNEVPAISSQPSSQTACSGSAASFSVTASGTGISYQWRKGSINLPGETATSLSIASVASGDAGSYDVVVSGLCTPTVTSSAVTLTVNTEPAVTTPPSNVTACAGSPASFTVATTGSVVSYQWRQNTSPISGATSATYNIASIASGNAGSYDVVVTGPCGSVTSSAGILTVDTAPTITTQPTAQITCVGSSATFSVIANGTNPTYQWQKAGSPIPGATSATYTIANAAALDAVTYDVVVSGTCNPPVTSTPVTLTVNAPSSISSQPTSQTVCSGAFASFSISATGAGLTFQWRKAGVDLVNGPNISGATSATLSITSAGTSDAGSYDVVVGGTCSGTTTSSPATLTVNTAPSISIQPASQTVCSGTSLTLFVTASGTDLTYQWQKDTVDVPGATAASLIINPVNPSDAGSYRVLIGGACLPALTSSAATLAVTVPPNITTQPVAQTVCAGGSASFSVIAGGLGPFTYQWRKGGVNIAGATASTYTIPTVSGSDAAIYDVIVTGGCSPGVQSSGATLIVNPLPSITTQPIAQTVCSGATASFQVVAAGAGPLTYQWRKNTVNIPGATFATLTVDSVEAAHVGSYDVVVSGFCAPPVTSSAVALALKPPPAITTHPVAQTVCSGSPASLTVTAVGVNLNYQWSKDGSNLVNGGTIAGVTTATLSISSVSPANAGTYEVVVTGDCGSAITSGTAALTVPGAVGAAGSITGVTTVCAGTTGATYSVSSVSGAITYTWTVPAGSSITSGQGTATIDVTFGSAAGNVTVTPSNVCFTGTAATLPVTVLVPPTLSTQPLSQTLCLGASASFSVGLTGASGTLTYQWRKNGGNLSNGGSIAGADAATLVLSSLILNDGGNYDVVVTGTCAPPATSASATLIINSPVSISQSPVAQAICVGGAVNFSVTASGVGLTYQWRKDGVNLTNGGGYSGVTAAQLAVSGINTSHAGSYDVVVSASCGAPQTSSAALLTVKTLPAITTQPVSVSICGGQSVTFSVAATGSNLTYQWRKKGVAISGATSATYTVASTGAADAGDYTVLVTGACTPAVTSNVATLVLGTPVQIVGQPRSQTLCAGAAATFSVQATGSVTAGTDFAFQWRKGGVAIAGATKAVYTIPAIAAADAGSYDVTISNICGLFTSTAAVLTVPAPAACTVQPVDVTALEGATASLSVAATGSGLTYQWRKSGKALADGSGVSGSRSATLNVVTTTALAGDYDVVVKGTCGTATTSSTAKLGVNGKPRITVQPKSLTTVCEGSPATVTVTATGAGLTYQWRKAGVNIAGATSSSLTIDAVGPAEVGAYTVVVSGVAGAPSVTSTAANLATIKPIGTIGPIIGAINVCAGKAGLAYSVAVVTNATKYVWTVPTGARIVAGQGTRAISVTWGTSPGDVSVNATNTCFTGTARTLSVSIPTLTITEQPTDQTLLEDCNRNVTFKAAADGSPAPRVQWQSSVNAGKTWLSMSGRTNTSLILTNPTPTQNGNKFRAVFSNGCAASTSSAATLIASRIQTTSGVVASPESQQYSDKVTVEAAITPGPASSCGLKAATNVTFYIGTRKLATVAMTPDGDILAARLSNVVVLEKPGVYQVKAIFGGVSPYFSVANATNTLTVTAEDARVTYTGPTEVKSTAAGRATVALKVTVKDISGMPANPAFDADAGKIANARVAFVNRSTTPATIIGEVAVVASADPKVGTASFSFPVNLGTEASMTYTIGIVVKNFYTEDNDQVITVRKP